MNVQANIDMDKLIPVASVSWGGNEYGGVNLKYLRGVILGSDKTDDENLLNAVWLTGFCHKIFESYGTDGDYVRKFSITNEQSRALMLLLITLCRKMNIGFDSDFRDFDEFYSYWCGHGAKGSYSDRRSILSDVFDPLLREFEDRQIDQDVHNDSLVLPVSPSRKLGWSDIDDEIGHMREDFKRARDTLDYSNIGNDAEGIVEKLSSTVFDIADSDGLIRDDERAGLSEGKTKNRLQFFVERKTDGDSKKLQELCKVVVELAQSMKHNRRTSTRKSAGIAADSVIMLANILRRLDG
jgi:hypothetical protein